MNNTHTKAMEAHAFTGSAVVAWACRSVLSLGLGAPAYRADIDTPVAIPAFPQDLDPPSSPS